MYKLKRSFDGSIDVESIEITEYDLMIFAYKELEKRIEFKECFCIEVITLEPCWIFSHLLTFNLRINDEKISVIHIQLKIIFDKIELVEIKEIN